MQLSFRNGSRGEELELSISGPLLPSKADGKMDVLNGCCDMSGLLRRSNKQAVIQPRHQRSAETRG